ncbi:hypothetical protein BH18ACI5_BH18ACI5_13540 [soil metagenome]
MSGSVRRAIRLPGVEAIRGRSLTWIVFLAGCATGFASFAFALGRVYAGQALPYVNPERLILVRLLDSAERERGLSISQYRLLEQQTHLFEAVAAHRPGAVLRLQTPIEPVAIISVAVSRNFFRVLGVDLSVVPEWETYRGKGDLPLVLGTRGQTQLPFPPGVRLERQGGARVLLAGRTDRSFVFPTLRATGAAYQPLVLDEATTDTLTVIARLRPSVTLGSALDAELSGLFAGYRESRVRSASLHERLTQRTRRVGYGAWALALLMLFGAAANLSNFLLVTTHYGSHVYATRVALGARPRHLFVSFGIGLLLQWCGGSAAALLVLAALVHTWLLVVPAELRLLGSPAVGTPEILAVLFTCAALLMSASTLSLLTIWRLCVAPCFFDRRPETSSRRLVRGAQIGAQVTTAVVMLVAGSVAAIHYVRLSTIETGFNQDLFITSVSYPHDTGGDILQATTLKTLGDLQALPSVEKAGLVVGTLFDATNLGAFVMGPKGESLPVSLKYASKEFLEIAGVRLVAGRMFSIADEAWASGVVSRSLSRRFATTPQDALGAVLRTPAYSLTVVGVVEDVRDVSMDTEPAATLYTPVDKIATPALVHYVLRFRGALENGDLVRQAIRRASPDGVVVSQGSIRSRLTNSVGTQRAALIVAGIFGVFTVGLVAGGVASTVSFIVARRRQEIAVRLALGASPRHIYRVLSREAASGTALGLGVGAILGWQLLAIGGAFLGTDTRTALVGMAVAVVTIALVVTSATLLPGRRALALPVARMLRE